MGTLAFPTIDSLISKFEGFGTPNALTINLANNPGAIAPGKFATAHGATGTLTTSGGQPIAAFPDVQTGTAAEDALVQYYANQNASIADLINAWSPATAPGNSPAATQNYIHTVAQGVNATPGTPVTAAELAYDALNNVPTSLGTQAGQTTYPSLPPTTPSTGTSGASSGNQVPGAGSSTTAKPAAGSGTGADCVPSWSNVWCLSFGRVGAFLLGLILIGAGLMMFKPVQETVARGGELLAA